MFSLRLLHNNYLSSCIVRIIPLLQSVFNHNYTMWHYIEIDNFDQQLYMRIFFSLILWDNLVFWMIQSCLWSAMCSCYGFVTVLSYICSVLDISLYQEGLCENGSVWMFMLAGVYSHCFRRSHAFIFQMIISHLYFNYFYLYFHLIIFHQ